MNSENLLSLRQEFRQFITSTRSLTARFMAWALPVALFVIAGVMLIFLTIHPQLALEAFYVIRRATRGLPQDIYYLLPLLFVLAGAWFFIKDFLKIKERIVTTFPSKPTGIFLKKLATYDFQTLASLRDYQDGQSFYYLKIWRRLQIVLSGSWFLLAFLSEKLVLVNAFLTETIFHLKIGISVTVLTMLMLYACDLMCDELFYLPRLVRVFVAMAISMKENKLSVAGLLDPQKNNE